MFANSSRTLLAATVAGLVSVGPALAFPQGGQAKFNPHAQPHINPNALKPGGVKQVGGFQSSKPKLPPVGQPPVGGPAKVPGYGGDYGGGYGGGYGPSKGPNGWAMAGAGLGIGLAAGAVGAAVAAGADDGGDCYVVRRRYIDEDGNVFVRRFTRCD